MRLVDKAHFTLQRSVKAARGYLELAALANDVGKDSSTLKEYAMQELRKFSDNDDYIDAIYDECCEITRKEIEQENI